MPNTAQKNHSNINVKIYYMSGTGNSYRVSTWMDEFSRKNGANSQICSVDRVNRVNGAKVEDKTKDGSDSLLGIVFPTHGFTAPWHVIKFALRLPRGKSTRAFSVATRAGTKFGPIFLPGISGSATFIIALILFIKGYKVRGLMSVDMPSNWFSLHKIQRKKTLHAIINRGKPLVEDFMERLLSGRKVRFTLNNLYELLFGTILLIVSLGYLLIARFFMAKLFFANERCNGCGVCADNCFIGAIKMRGTKKPRPFWKYNCENCMRCSAVCPQNCIEAGHSWGVIVYLITTIPVSTYLISYLGRFIPDIAELQDHWFVMVLNLLFLYLAIFISYYIFYALTKIPIFNWLFTHTTLTHFSFWGRYHEPDTKLTKLKT